MTITMAKEDRIHVRTTSNQKSLLQQAAEIEGRSVSEFVLDAAIEKAENAVLDQTVFFIGTDAYDQIISRSKDVERNKEILTKLMSKPSPWSN